MFLNQKLLLGPTQDGTFKPVQIREIQFLRVTVNEICCGNSCSMKLKSLDKNFELNTDSFKKGMVLLDSEIKLEPTLEFEVEALIVHHSSTIKVGYQSVVHCHVVRQTCTIVAMDKEFLRSGDGRTRGKGKIIKIFPIDIKEIEKEKNMNQSKKNKKSEIHNKNKNNNNANNNTNNININYNPQTKKEKKKFYKYKNKEKQNENNNNNNNNKSEDKKSPPKKKEG